MEHPTRWRPVWLLVAVCLGAICPAAAGCASAPAYRSARGVGVSDDLGPFDNPELVFADRLDQGYVLILPGAWGNVPMDYGLVSGLQDANVPAALEVCDWTVFPPLVFYNMRADRSNREEAQRLAKRIVAYQARYPGRPVHVIGYSGGGGIAVLALEALPPGQRVTSAILLAPALAYNHDLQPALSRTERGIWNYYSVYDTPILGVLAAAVGNIDTRHTLAAGAVGFQAPSGLEGEQLALYQQQVHQQPYQFNMILDGHPGGHFGWSNRRFITRHVAPLLLPDTAQATWVAGSPTSAQ